MHGAEQSKPGPLSGLMVVEMAGLGPAPLAALILSELGADVVRIERIRQAAPFIPAAPEHDISRHGRTIVRLDLKASEGREVALGLMAASDVVIEGFRPGVMEKLGLGPEPVMAANPRLVYGRMTGFGQDGPLAARAGHDLTYLALTGLLGTIGPKDGKPVPPLNLVADYGGGTMFLLLGVLAALFERMVSGRGQVVDAAMIDGASMLGAPVFAMLADGVWEDRRGSNLLDSGAPFYDTYETSDGGYVAVAALEPQFFAELVTLLDLDRTFIERQYDRSLWPSLREALSGKLKTRSRDEWDAVFRDTDACVAPVLSLAEAAEHPHNLARRVHGRQDGFLRPEPAPRFGRTPGERARPAASGDDELRSVLARAGFGDEDYRKLVEAGIIGA